MHLYRITRERYAGDLSGEGARLYGGRWNNPGVACLYTSCSSALAVLEFAVQYTLEEMPPDMVLIRFDLSDKARVVKPYDNSLPASWKRAGSSSETRSFGDGYLTRGEQLGIRLPSAVVPFEWNVLLRPSMLGSRQLRVVDTQPLELDHRLKR